MIDMLGNQLSIGDKVIYSQKVYMRPMRHPATVKSPLAKGIIERFYGDRAVIGDSRISSQCILKHEWPDEQNPEETHDI